MTPAEFRAARRRITPTAEELAARVDRDRDVPGLLQVELAARLGVDPMTVWRKEHGQLAITSRDVAALKAWL